MMENLILGGVIYLAAVISLEFCCKKTLHYFESRNVEGYYDKPIATVRLERKKTHHFFLVILVAFSLFILYLKNSG